MYSEFQFTRRSRVLFHRIHSRQSVGNFHCNGPPSISSVTAAAAIAGPKSGSRRGRLGMLARYVAA